MGAQWKIIHDFKPTAYLTDDNCNGETDPGTIDVNLTCSASGLNVGGYCMAFPVGVGCVKLYLDDVPPEVASMQLPAVGEWTRVELTQEFDDTVGTYFVSLSFAGVEVIRVEANPVEDLVDIDIELGEPDVQVPGFMRRLIVLEKS